MTLDAPVKASALSANQLWPYQDGASAYWGSDLNPGPKPPAIAIVDSGIERGVVGFGVAGSRIVRREVIASLPAEHERAGTAVGTAPSSRASRQVTPPGTPASRRAELVALDVLDDRAGVDERRPQAAQWIYENRAKYNIRVANFSLLVGSDRASCTTRSTGRSRSSGCRRRGRDGRRQLRSDGGQRRPLRTGNDPFVITVGAADINGTVSRTTTSTPLVGVRLHATTASSSRSSARRAGT